MDIKNTNSVGQIAVKAYVDACKRARMQCHVTVRAAADAAAAATAHARDTHRQSVEEAKRAHTATVSLARQEADAARSKAFEDEEAAKKSATLACGAARQEVRSQYRPLSQPLLEARDLAIEAAQSARYQEVLHAELECISLQDAADELNIPALAQGAVEDRTARKLQAQRNRDAAISRATEQCNQLVAVHNDAQARVEANAQRLMDLACARAEMDRQAKLYQCDQSLQALLDAANRQLEEATHRADCALKAVEAEVKAQLASARAEAGRAFEIAKSERMAAWAREYSGAVEVVEQKTAEALNRLP